MVINPIGLQSSISNAIYSGVQQIQSGLNSNITIDDIVYTKNNVVNFTISGSNEIQYVNPYFTSKIITFPGLKIRSTDNNLTFDLSFNAEFFDGYTHTDPFGGDDNFDYTETMYYSVVNVSNEGIIEISGNNIYFYMLDLIGDNLNIDIIFSVRSYETIQYLLHGDHDIRSTTIPIVTGNVINNKYSS